MLDSTLGKGFAVGRRKSNMPSTAKWITADFFDLDLQYLGKVRIPAFFYWDQPFLCNRAVDAVARFFDDALFILRKKDEDDEEDKPDNTNMTDPTIEMEEGEGIYETYLEKWTVSYGEKNAEKPTTQR